MTAISGIFLNHRKLVSGIAVSRNLLPASYQFNNWNNGAVKGSFHLTPDSVLVYGGSGIWLTDNYYITFNEFTQGLKSGTDNRITSKIVKTANGHVFAATTFDLYQLSSDNSWKNITERLEVAERISDLVVRGDSLIVLSRSQLYLSTGNHTAFTSIELKEPRDYSPKVSLFRTLWLLHSGELFGLPGQLFVDLLGVLLIVICVTGLLFTFLPGIIRRRKKRNQSVERAKKAFRASIKWHNKPGAIFLWFLLVVSISGMFLRPPLLIAIINANVSPIPGTKLNDSNPWHDKLRCIIYDSTKSEWLLYSSSGFYAFKALHDQPHKVNSIPPVSVMGVTVLEPAENGFLVGSFSGLYRWNRDNGTVIDCYTNTPVKEVKASGRPVFNHTVSGLIRGTKNGDIVFEYDEGAIALNDNSQFSLMPEKIKEVKMSLWHACLEIHVGRAYHPFIGPFSDLFVFLMGFLLTFILISGYVVYRKNYANKKKSID